MVAEWTEQNFEENRREKFYQTNNRCRLNLTSVILIWQSDSSFRQLLLGHSYLF